MLVVYHLLNRLNTYRGLERLPRAYTPFTPSIFEPRGWATGPPFANVSFSDQDGVKREGRCDLLRRDLRVSRKWLEKRLPGYVGLLYAPYMKNVVITDLWLK